MKKALTGLKTTILLLMAWNSGAILPPLLFEIFSKEATTCLDAYHKAKGRSIIKEKPSALILEKCPVVVLRLNHKMIISKKRNHDIIATILVF